VFAQDEGTTSCSTTLFFAYLFRLFRELTSEMLTIHFFIMATADSLLDNTKADTYSVVSETITKLIS